MTPRAIGRRAVLRIGLGAAALGGAIVGACGDSQSAFEDYSFPKSQAREGNPQRYITDAEQARLRQQWLDKQAAKKSAAQASGG